MKKSIKGVPQDSLSEKNSKERIKSNTKQDQSKSNLKGIEGVLFFFIVTLLFGMLRSIVFGIQMISEFESILQTSSLPEAAVSSALIFFIASTLIITIFYLYFTVIVIKALQRMKPYAVSRVKLFLLFVGLSVFIGLLMTGGKGITTEEIHNSSRVIISAAIWMSYFFISKRVKTTYPEKSRIILKKDIILTVVGIFLSLSFPLVMSAYMASLGT